MAGSMSMADLVADLKASLHDAAGVFTAANDADFERIFINAALGFARVRSRTLVGTVTLTADQPNYPAPADLLMVKSPLWGTTEKRRGQPWERNYPGRLPRIKTVQTAGSTRELWLDPAPTAAQIVQLGAEYKFFYFAGHQVGAAAADTTVVPGDRALLLLRAQAETMKELAMRNMHKPVSLRDGMSGAPRNGIPAALYEQLMEDFMRQAA